MRFVPVCLPAAPSKCEASVCAGQRGTWKGILEEAPGLHRGRFLVPAPHGALREVLRGVWSQAIPP